MLSLRDVLRWLATARAVVIDLLNLFGARRRRTPRQLTTTATSPHAGEDDTSSDEQEALVSDAAQRQPVPTFVDPLPSDAEFQRLQLELQLLVDASERLHRNYAELVAANELVRPLLDELHEKITHRLRRARARHVRHLREHEREFAMEDAGKARKRRACPQCRQNRAVSKNAHLNAGAAARGDEEPTQ
ncbi:hypothetical protein P43SY_002339 [Pythium insidiosum]|uniref:Uncharacterized protein n=1 Tax=Pythium insidiosum TaxID=114742 RepID=A0AAD5MIV9_PYTIN|nr:hypothetical protein P43SY_002339 [Pythium insidiosum]